MRQPGRADGFQACALRGAEGALGRFAGSAIRNGPTHAAGVAWALLDWQTR